MGGGVLGWKGLGIVEVRGGGGSFGLEGASDRGGGGVLGWKGL